MCRSIVAVVVGSVVALMVGWVNWTVLNLWEDAFKPLPPAVESAMVPMIESQLGPGAWFFPGMDMEAMMTLPEAEQEKAFAAYSAIHEKGPVGMIMVAPGSVPMAPSTFGKAMIFNALGAIGVALVLCCCRGGVLCRWLRASAVVLLITTIFYGSLVNWMGLPAQFVGRMAGDVVLTWTVVAFVMALIMRRGGCCGTKPGAAGDGSGVVGCGCS
ncbi:MAG: hypothetical protein RL527_1250 [Planctomycetota bacterium]|jgi:hypothetical protein